MDATRPISHVLLFGGLISGTTLIGYEHVFVGILTLVGGCGASLVGVAIAKLLDWLDTEEEQEKRRPRRSKAKTAKSAAVRKQSQPKKV